MFGSWNAEKFLNWTYKTRTHIILICSCGKPIVIVMKTDNIPLKKPLPDGILIPDVDHDYKLWTLKKAGAIDEINNVKSNLSDLG